MVPVTKVYGIQHLGSGACSVKRNVHCCCARAPQASSPPTEGPRRSPEAKKMATPENPLTKCVGTPKTFCSTRKKAQQIVHLWRKRLRGAKLRVAISSNEFQPGSGASATATLRLTGNRSAALQQSGSLSCHLWFQALALPSPAALRGNGKAS